VRTTHDGPRKVSLSHAIGRGRRGATRYSPLVSVTNVRDPGPAMGHRVALSGVCLVRVFVRLRLILSRWALPTRDARSLAVNARRRPWPLWAFQHGRQDGWAADRRRQDYTFGGNTHAALGPVDGLGRVKDERTRHGRAREVERHVDEDRENECRVPLHAPHSTRPYTVACTDGNGRAPGTAQPLRAGRQPIERPQSPPRHAPLSGACRAACLVPLIPHEAGRCGWRRTTRA
jgi:hypothetical protein